MRWDPIENIATKSGLRAAVAVIGELVPVDDAELNGQRLQELAGPVSNNLETTHRVFSAEGTGRRVFRGFGGTLSRGVSRQGPADECAERWRAPPYRVRSKDACRFS